LLFCREQRITQDGQNHEEGIVAEGKTAESYEEEGSQGNEGTNSAIWSACSVVWVLYLHILEG
jgi:hypothetical protein